MRAAGLCGPSGLAREEVGRGRASSFTLPVGHALPPPTQIRASPHMLPPIWSLEVQRQKERPAGGMKTVPGALLLCPLPGTP